MRRSVAREGGFQGVPRLGALGGSQPQEAGGGGNRIRGSFAPTGCPVMPVARPPGRYATTKGHASEPLPLEGSAIQNLLDVAKTR